MNILDSSLKLYEWFDSNDSFCLEEDFLKLVLVSGDPERDKAAMLLALGNLEKYEIIQSREVEFKKEKRRVWVIERPLETLPQKVDIDYSLALSIAHVSNDAAEKYNVKESVCDAGNITADNLKDLLVLAGINLKSEEELDKEA
jgi:hypothetical protein